MFDIAVNREERRIMELIVKYPGLKVNRIAHLLHLSQKTVNSYLCGTLRSYVIKDSSDCWWPKTTESDKHLQEATTSSMVSLPASSITHAFPRQFCDSRLFRLHPLDLAISQASSLAATSTLPHALNEVHLVSEVHSASGLDASLSESASTGVRLDAVIESASIQGQLTDLGLSSSSDLWILLALNQAADPLLGNSLLLNIAQNLASICSPFLPTYELDYSVLVESELDTRKTETNIRTKTTYRVQIRLSGAIFCSSAIIPFGVDEYFDPNARSNEIVAVLKRCGKYEPFPDSGVTSAITPVRLPVLKELLLALTKKQRDVIVRRNGLTGRIETLEEIAVEWDLTRERIRQIEEKASRRIRHPSKPIPLKNFKQYVKNWVSTKGNVVSFYGILDHFQRYIDFVEYSPSMSMALLCWFSGLYVQYPDEKNDVWFAATSEDYFRKFEQTVKLLTGLDLEDKQSRVLLTRETVDGALTTMRLLSLDEIESIQNTVERIIGSSRVMRLEDFISCLTREHPQTKYLINNNNTAENRYRLLLMTGRASLIQAAEYEKQLLGDWVVLKLTDRAESIARAIVYAGANQAMKPIRNLSSLKHGARLDFIVQDIMSRSGFIMNEHGVSEICRRNPEVFIQTDDNCWGLIGCGAVRNEHLSEQNNRNERIVDVMTRALLFTRDGLTLQELIRQVREAVPNASENTIRIYLTTLHRDKFEETANARYILSKRYLTHLADPSEQETVISLVIRVLKEADNPLYVDEIIERCQQRQFVAESAIRGYLAQNYRELFQKHEGGKYSLL